jgi:hypothetical protein
MTPEDPIGGLGVIGGLLLLRMGLIVAFMLGYRAFARPGVIPFALAVVGMFLVGHSIELVRYSGLVKRSRRPPSDSA